MEGIGLVRAMKFAKYLPEYGWEPVVLTVKPTVEAGADPGQTRVYRTGYVDIIEKVKGLVGMDNGRREVNKTLAARGSGEKKGSGGTFLRELISLPDEEIGWYNFALEEGKKILRDEKIDLIFSTSPPETAHLIARKLKRHRHLPWIADLRDLWADDHFRSRPAFKKMALALIRALTDIPLRKQVIEAARKRVVQTFDNQALIGSLAAVYRQEVREFSNQ